MLKKLKGISFKQILKDNWIMMIPYVMFILLVITIGVINPNTLSMRWLAGKSDAVLSLVLVSIGQTLVLLTGGFDLSVGGVICVTNSFAALYMGDSTGSILLCVLICMLFGVAVGLVNGVAVVKTGIQPFIVTLATQSVCYGIALLIMNIDGGNVPIGYINVLLHRFGNIPVSMIILLILILVWMYVKRTAYGLSIYAIGSSEKSAHLNGITVNKVRISVYALSGLFAAFAGLFRTAQVASGSPTAGADFVMTSITAAVIGGTALSGGVGGIVGTIVGAFVLRYITDLLVFMEVSSYWTSLVQGVLLILAVAASAYGAIRKKRGGNK